MTTKRPTASATVRVEINIPANLDFASLKLSRDSVTGDVSFDTTVINRIEAASKLPGGYFMGLPEDALAGMLVRWYDAHRAAGGAPDPVAEDLLTEVRAEDAAGQKTSHKPGRA